ncbi:MAG: Na+/H+ antiporter NhaC family protein [Desulfovibrionaceae bacterium]|nr:Na+/H+ antiporter NhaC family protein [Desulfovibrionaceae bacterium]
MHQFGSVIQEKPENGRALLPIAVFMAFYLGLGVLFEYVLDIPMGFYNVPVIIAFLLGIAVACRQSRDLSGNERLEIMAEAMADRNIITMILIFLLAGIFVGVVGRSGASSVANCILSFLPAEWTPAAIFVISAFVSLSMGTSCGTITVITPLAVSLSDASGFSLPLCLGAVMGGAMFGDNLSFISDTTIAACNGQGCPMQAKFRENFRIALPAALITLVITHILAQSQTIAPANIQPYSLINIIPYLLVLIGGIIGCSVFSVLIVGILSGLLIMLVSGNADAITLLKQSGSGAAGMFETSMVAILAASLAGLMRRNGGFAALLGTIRRTFRSHKGGQFGIGLLVGLMDIATANNTVAIVISNPIAREIADEYGVSPSRTASILDTFSCIFQGIIPYGAQMLILLAAASTMGHTLSAMHVMPMLIYPMMLAVSCTLFVVFAPEKRKA